MLAHTSRNVVMNSTLSDLSFLATFGSFLLRVSAFAEPRGSGFSLAELRGVRLQPDPLLARVLVHPASAGPHANRIRSAARARLPPARAVSSHQPARGMGHPPRRPGRSAFPAVGSHSRRAD